MSLIQFYRPVPSILWQLAEEVLNTMSSDDRHRCLIELGDGLTEWNRRQTQRADREVRVSTAQ